MGDRNADSRILKALLPGLALLLAVIVVRYPYISRGRLPVTDAALQSITFPFQKLRFYLQDKRQALTHHFSDLDELKRENRRLSRDLDLYMERARLAEEALREREDMLDALQLSFYESGRYRIGTVISRSPSRWYRTIFINQGLNTDVDVDDSVLTGAGLVGRVVAVGENRSKALLITDPTSAVSVMVRRTRDHGILYGLGESDKLEIRFVSAEADVREGDLVETSGLGGVYARGIPVGRAVRVVRDKNYSTLRVFVEPFVDFSHIEKILVIKERPR